MKTATITHTPEPWMAEVDLSLSEDPSALVTCADGSTVAIVVANGDVESSAITNAQRICACVNALAAFPDPARDVAELVEKLRDVSYLCHDLREWLKSMCEPMQARRADLHAQEIDALLSRLQPKATP